MQVGTCDFPPRTERERDVSVEWSSGASSLAFLFVLCCFVSRSCRDGFIGREMFPMSFALLPFLGGWDRGGLKDISDWLQMCW